MIFKVFRVLFVWHFIFCFCGGSRLLFLFPFSSKSHNIFYSAVVDVLAQDGHNITAITCRKLGPKHENVREILLPERYRDDDLFLKNVFNNTWWETWNQWQKLFMEKMPEMCVDSFLEDDVQRVLQEEYDLAFIPFFMSNCYLPYLNQRKIPFILLFVNKIFPSLSDVIGNLDTPSIASTYVVNFVHPMTFFERAAAAVLSVTDVFNARSHTFPVHEKVFLRRGLMSKNSPSIFEICKTASLLILNSNRFSEHPARLNAANVIFAAGVHIKPTGIIPKNLKNWLDESGDAGFILFSLGSILNPKELPRSHFEILLKVFGSLKQRVLWKWNSDEPEGVPRNIMFSKWVPQQDVLKHPRIRLFISHGGLFSLQEATYFQVPVLGMPVFIDQHSNVEHCLTYGVCKKQTWADLNETVFRNLILDTINDNDLRENLKRKSNIMKDLPRPPSTEISYWVNYTLKHKDMNHLRTPLVHMSWFEIYNMDVWLLFAFIVLGTLVIPTFMLYKLFRYLCCDQKAKKFKKT